MANLEDKILGEKLHNYCSSSEDSGDEEQTNESEVINASMEAESSETNEWTGTSTNTGPKGVINDWQRYKQLETEKRAEDESERRMLYEKLSMTVRSSLDEERDKAKMDDPETAEILNDEYLVQYQTMRMQEMLQRTRNLPTFGKLTYLPNSDAFLDAVDNEDKRVNVILHINDDRLMACRSMNEALQQLSQVYINVKFCSIDMSRVRLSRQFRNTGVPALLIYKSGVMIGNFVEMGNNLGNHFDAEDLQNYLIEHGMLDDRTLSPAIVRKKADDDFDTDSD